MFKFGIVILFLLGIVTPEVIAQTMSDKQEPNWMKKIPSQTNETFKYETVSSFGDSLNDAREKCFAILMANSGLANGVVIVVNNNSSETINKIYNNGKLTEEIRYDGMTSINSKSSEVSLQVLTIDEYWEYSPNLGYYLTVLYAKSKNNEKAMFDEVEITKSYGMRGIWRSAIIPGWGQFYKGSKIKGAVFLGGTAALAGGIIFSENKRTTYNRNIAESYNSELKRYYANKSSTMSNARNICIGGAVALYIYNLIDAAVAPGAKRIKVTKSKVARHHFSVSPTIKQNMTGMALTYNF